MFTAYNISLYIVIMECGGLILSLMFLVSLLNVLNVITIVFTLLPHTSLTIHSLIVTHLSFHPCFHAPVHIASDLTLLMYPACLSLPPLSLSPFRFTPSHMSSHFLSFHTFPALLYLSIFHPIHYIPFSNHRPFFASRSHFPPPPYHFLPFNPFLRFSHPSPLSTPAPHSFSKPLSSAPPHASLFPSFLPSLPVPCSNDLVFNNHIITFPVSLLPSTFLYSLHVLPHHASFSLHPIHTISPPPPPPPITSLLPTHTLLVHSC